MALTQVLSHIVLLFLKVNTLELLFGLHDLGVGSLLNAIEAGHEDDCSEKETENDHKEQESLIVKVVGGKCRLNRHLVSHFVDDVLWNSVAVLLEPARVIENNEDLIVNLVFGKELGVCGRPLTDLLVDAVWLVHHEVTLLALVVLNPQRHRLNVAIVVTFILKDKDVELCGCEQAEYGARLDTLDLDLMLRLSDICT